MTPGTLIVDPVLDVIHRPRPLPEGHEIVGGLTSDGIPVAVLARVEKEDRLRRIADERRADLAARRRLVAIVDDPGRSAEKDALADRVNGPAIKRLRSRWGDVAEEIGPTR